MIKVSFTGDLLFGPPINELCREGNHYDYSPLFKDIVSILSDSDYLVGNLESPVAGEEAGYTEERYCFNTPEEMLIALKEAGFDLISLANNHCMDRGESGITATLDKLDRYQLDHIGTNRSLEESNSIFVREIGGIKIGFVNATYGTNAFAHHRFLPENKKYMVDLIQPEETTAGAINLLGKPEEIEKAVNEIYGDKTNPIVAEYLERLEEKIRKTKAESDYVVMLFHSGGQYNMEIDAFTEMMADKIREFGADIIVCNHPHHILPSKLDGDYFTAFCLGNFVCCSDHPDWCQIDPDYSAVLNLYLEKKNGKINRHITFSLCRVMFENGKPYVVDTYNNWMRGQSEQYKKDILFFANRFMPGMNYTEPMGEYPVC